MLNKWTLRAGGILLALALLLTALPMGALMADDEEPGTGDAAPDTDTADAGEDTDTPEGGEPDEPAAPDAPLVSRTHSLKGADGVHDGYATGYTDRTFRPEESLTRAQAAALLYRVIAQPGEERMALSDVPAGTWYTDPVEYLAAVGALEVYNGAARPHEALSRGEFAAMVVRLVLGTDFEPAETSPFLDVPEDSPWAAEIARAASLGWIKGFGGGEFRPEERLTRAQAVSVINRLLGAVPDREYLSGLYFSQFTDVTASHWAYYSILEATIPHAHQGSGAGPWISGDLSAIAQPRGKYFDGLDYYYFGQDGQPVRNGTVGGLTFGPDGRFTSGSAELDGYVKDVLASVTTSGMTDAEKLRAAYLYARDSFTYLRRNYYEVGDTGWANQEALTMFTTRRGNCYCYAAVFYSLARQLGFDALLISGKVNNSNPIPHAWVEIPENGVMYMYDPELEMAHRRDGDPRDLYRMAYEDTPWSYWR